MSKKKRRAFMPEQNSGKSVTQVAQAMGLTVKKRRPEAAP